MTQPNQQQSAQQIRALIDKWLQATRTGDVDTVLTLMTDDALFLTPGNPPMTRDNFAAISRSMAGKILFDAHSEVQEITVTGDTAICVTRLEIAVTPLAGGPTVKRAGNTLSILRLGDDAQWRIWRDATMLGAV